jgi:hypothetical protein
VPKARSTVKSRQPAELARNIPDGQTKCGQAAASHAALGVTSSDFRAFAADIVAVIFSFARRMNAHRGIWQPHSKS